MSVEMEATNQTAYYFKAYSLAHTPIRSKYLKVMEHKSIGPESGTCKLGKMTVNLRDGPKHLACFTIV
jgi:hypothetical protein